MDTVIIIGADGEPSLSIARRLCGMGIRVYAFAGTIPESGLSADEFIPVPCDLTSPIAVETAIKEILKKEPHIAGTLLAGQYLSEEHFEALSTEEIALALNAQLVSPLCAVRLVLPRLIAGRGHVVVISPGAGTSAGRTLNAVADAALRSFTGTLFAELRDTGVKTCHILLQNNEGAPDPAARFTTMPQSRVHADIVADAVETVFKLRENNALTQMILRPQATRESPHIPVSAEPKIRALQNVQLPPARNFPTEGDPIPTAIHRRPDYAPAKNLRTRESDEDDGFADDYVDPELRYLVKDQPTQGRPQQNPQRNNNNNGNARPAKNIGHNNPNASQGNREGQNRWQKHHGQNRNFDGAQRQQPPPFNNTPQKAHNAPAAGARADTADEKRTNPANIPQKAASAPPQKEIRRAPEKIEQARTPREDNSVKKEAQKTGSEMPLNKNKKPQKRAPEKSPKVVSEKPSPEKKRRAPQKRKLPAAPSQKQSREE